MTDGGPPSRRKIQAAATRKQLLRAARDIFEEKGYRATTIAAITERADTAHGTFYLYFRNKEEVFCEMIEVMTRSFYVEAVVDWQPTGRETMRHAVRAVMQTMLHHRGLFRALLEGALLEDGVRRMWIDVRGRLLDRMSKVIVLQQELGVIRPFDAKSATRALGSMAEWTALTELVLVDEVPGEAAVEGIIDVITDLAMTALYPGNADV
jgi:AcrR family transcriptional regulator